MVNYCSKRSATGAKQTFCSGGGLTFTSNLVGFAYRNFSQKEGQMTQQALWPQRTNRLIAAAEDCGVDFTTVPPEGESVLTAVAGCLEILEIDPVQVLEEIKKDPKYCIPELVVTWALWEIASVLLFEDYQEDYQPLNKEQTNALRKHLKAIVVRKGVMATIDKLYIIQPSQGRDGIGVGSIIRGQAKKAFIA